MKFVTQQDAITAAEKGIKAALDCIELHWWQMSHCTARSLRAADGYKDFETGAYCAMCQRKRIRQIANGIHLGSKCEDCIIYKICIGYGTGLWKTAANAYNDWYHKKGTLKAFQIEATKLWKAIKEINEAYK